MERAADVYILYRMDCMSNFASNQIHQRVWRFQVATVEVMDPLNL